MSWNFNATLQNYNFHREKTQVTAMVGGTRTTQHMCGLGGDGNTHKININVISCGSRNKKLPSIIDPSVPAASSSAAA